MGDHDNVGFIPNNRASPTGVGLYNVLAKEGIFYVWKIHRTENCRLETIGFGVIEVPQIFDGLLFLVQYIWDIVSAWFGLCILPHCDWTWLCYLPATALQIQSAS
jgi:hypothetical protein